MTSTRKPISKSLRFRVLRRDEFTCQYCGKTAPAEHLHVDHITPVVDGGSNDEWNLAASCQPCNSGKGVMEAYDSERAHQAREILLCTMTAIRMGASLQEIEDQALGYDSPFEIYNGIIGVVAWVPFGWARNVANDWRQPVVSVL